MTHPRKLCVVSLVTGFSFQCSFWVLWALWLYIEGVGKCSVIQYSRSLPLHHWSSSNRCDSRSFQLFALRVSLISKTKLEVWCLVIDRVSILAPLMRCSGTVDSPPPQRPALISPETHGVRVFETSEHPYTNKYKMNRCCQDSSRLYGHCILMKGECHLIERMLSRSRRSLLVICAHNPTVQYIQHGSTYGRWQAFGNCLW